jgi:GT2 family glycosyltransferase
MQGTKLAKVQESPLRTEANVLQTGISVAGRSRLRVDGKFFARGNRRVRIQGVTYGPFAPDKHGEPFPTPDRVDDDFARMQAIGINAIRVYHAPPQWFLERVDEWGMGIFADIPWRKHLCFLDSDEARKEARQFTQEVASRGRSHPCVLAYSIGNEIPPNIVRWHGARRIERFLAELVDIAKQTDPESLVTYTNYPSTEYLDLSFLDFATFNVYLHDRETFRRYLFRLQNLVGDKPLILGELGMDTLRHSETEQAQFLAGHVREATLAGLAGTFIFSWTDDWYTGGYPIRDWAFGITHGDRLPKASYHALREVFQSSTPEPASTAHPHPGCRCAVPAGSGSNDHVSPGALLPETPRVSVVVCSYNGGQTLEQCLRSLLRLDYPDYEIIVVDDGSTDDTRAILARFPTVRAIRQSNHGLAAARNVGLQAGTGSIVAYTDADCYADVDWLALLVQQFQSSTAAALGGPNLTAEDGRLPACVAASPGQPTHVLESDQVAEHIPGCNMAFRREALLAINGFDPMYKKAGDDVDVCWRLQQAGYWITFAPGAFVWHHRRQNPRAYLRQQAGYGEAEALLRFKHPAKFNGRGHGKWRGVLYGPSLQGLRLSEAIIYRGTFGTGLFQCVYQPGPSHWAMLPSTLEWHLAILLGGLAALFWPPAWIGVAAMLVLSLVVAVLQAAQARLAPAHEGFRSRLLITGLCYAQPLVRSWSRYRTRLFSYRPPKVVPSPPRGQEQRLPLIGSQTRVYWTEDGIGRLQLLGCVLLYLEEHGWGKTIDSGWSDWDLQIYCHPWTIVEVCTAQEDHGSGKHLLRVRYRLRASGYLKAVGVATVLAGAVAAGWQLWMAALGTGMLLASCLGLWWRGAYRASQAMSVFDLLAGDLGLIRCDASSDPKSPRAGSGDQTD